MDELQQIQFRIYKIITDEFAVTDESFDPSLPSEMRINLAFNFGEVDKLITVQVKCLFYQEEKLILAIAVSCFFAIDPMQWEKMYNKEEEILVIPQQPALHLASLTVSTARGVLHAKTENLPTDAVILPPVNLNELIKEKVIISLNR